MALWLLIGYTDNARQIITLWIGNWEAKMAIESVAISM
jgi:hypothetical protein